MNPREIEVHIEELVLHGFAPNERWGMADALQNELHGLLVKKGVPTAWLESPAQIDAGAVSLTKPSVVGSKIAQAIYGGGGR